jgi:hypothetical protein
VEVDFPIRKVFNEFPTRKVKVDIVDTELTAAEARAALADIERSRRRVIDEIDMPRWYWWGLAVGWVGLGIVTDLKHPWITVVATFVFGAVHAAVAQKVLGGRRRTAQLSVSVDLAGRSTPLLVIAGLMGLGALTVGGSLAASADGARHPVTIASVLVATLVVLGGPRLMSALRSRAV